MFLPYCAARGVICTEPWDASVWLPAHPRPRPNIGTRAGGGFASSAPLGEEIGRRKCLKAGSLECDDYSGHVDTADHGYGALTMADDHSYDDDGDDDDDNNDGDGDDRCS